MDYDLTIIIASLHEDSTLYATVHSCFAQKNISLQVLTSFKSPSRHVYTVSCSSKFEFTRIWGPDSGIADAWNHALPFIRGRYVMFLGRGDIFAHHESISKLLCSCPSSSNTIAYGNQYFVSNKGPRKVFPLPPAGHEKSYLKRYMCIPHASSLWPAHLFLNHSFNTRYKISVDYDFALRVLPICVFLYSDVDVVFADSNGLSSDRSLLLKVVKEDIQAKSTNGYSPLSGLFFNLKRIFRFLFA
jgi:hypothetical protein